MSYLDKYYDCTHPRLSEPRARTVANGATQHRCQCLDCGRPIGNPMRKALAHERVGGFSPAEFDEILYETRREAAEQRRLADRSTERTQWWQWYNEYLRGAPWQAKRALVLERANFLCEGCRQNTAVHVHHLSYEHAGDELLWELVAICQDCHDRAHAGADDAEAAP